MADAAAGGKSSKKNAKRQAARAKKRLLQDVEPSSSTPVSVEATATPQAVAPRPSAAPAGRSNVQSRVAALKEEMAAAKASGDRKRAQELREQIWLLNDQAAGVMGEGFERVAARMTQETESRSVAKPSEAAEAPRVTSGGPLSEPEKRLRALSKKLQQIEKIKAAQLEGKKLEEGQLQKLQTEDSLREEISGLEEMLSQAAL